MKQLTLYTLVLLLAASACRKDKNESYAVEKSFTDPQRTLDSFSKALQTPADGWDGYLAPGNGQLYHVYLQLDSNKKEVTMYSDASAESGATPAKSSYALNVTQAINASITFREGSGLGSILVDGKRTPDSTFSFSYSQGDTMVLLGNRYGDQLTLFKASATAKASYTSGKLGAAVSAIGTFLKPGDFKTCYTKNDSSLVLASNASRIFGFYTVGSNLALDKAMTDFAYNTDGITLRRPLTVAGTQVRALYWDDSKGTLYALIGGEKVYIVLRKIPVIPLHYLLGAEFPNEISAVTPLYENLPGWSTDFFNLWVQLHNNLQKSGLLLYAIESEALVNQNVFNFNVYFAQGTKLYLGQFQYKFTKTVDGTYTFTAVKPSGNAAIIAPMVKPFTDLLSQNHFKVDYYYDQKGGILLGKIICVEKSTIYWTGFFGSYVNG
ncbi:DUF4302 domain-containing protein [Chitinophaga vietnamensis]|uniref:DUF4302 domain-containing protein n=1 Tax=Chitinophaga vietnamensis TaxID=2593957 RepID=UPI0011781453|nr:DUF4302 domain-containing protein [Chitinophaga vietnamensis]